MIINLFFQMKNKKKFTIPQPIFGTVTTSRDSQHTRKMKIKYKIRSIMPCVNSTFRNVLPVFLRSVVYWVFAWVCCWLSGSMWSRVVQEHMETAGPYFYAGFPVWFVKTAANGSVGGGDYIPIRM